MTSTALDAPPRPAPSANGQVGRAVFAALVGVAVLLALALTAVGAAVLGALIAATTVFKGRARPDDAMVLEAQRTPTGWVAEAPRG